MLKVKLLQMGQNPLDMASSIHFIMTPDVEQDYLFLGDYESKGDSIAMSQADCLATLQFSTEVMQFELRLERVPLQVFDDL